MSNTGGYGAVNPARPTIRREPSTPERIRLDVPLPPVELQINRRLGRPYGYTVQQKKQAKNDAFMAFYAVVGPDPPVWRAVGASVVFHITRRQQVLDPDGAQGWLKHTQDQLASCLGINDRYFNWRSMTWSWRPDIQPHLEIELWDETTLYPTAVRPQRTGGT